MRKQDQALSHKDESPRWARFVLPYAALRLAGQAAELVGWVILARRLGTSSFGELSIIFLACRYGGIVADWGAVMRGARDVVDSSRGSIHGYIRLRARAAIALAAVGVLLLSLTGRTNLVPLVAVVLALGCARDWVALGRGQGTRSAVPIFLQGTVIAVTAPATASLWSGALVVGAGYATSAILSVLLNKVPEDSERGRNRTDAWMLVAVFSNQITSSFDTVLLGVLASSSAAGIYAAVYRIPNAWIAVLTAILAGVLPAATLTLQEGEERFRHLRIRSTKLSAAAAGFVMLSIPVGIFLVPLLFGDEYKAGRSAVAILLLATAVITLASPLHPLAVSHGSDRTYSLILVTGSAINLISNIALIPVLEMNGAALATLLSQTFIAVALWFLLNHQAKERMHHDEEMSGTRLKF